MTKQQLLSELQNEIFVALKPSGIHGIGVFAITDIPRGTRNIFSRDNGEWIQLSFEEAEKLPAHSREFVETYYLYDNKNYFIPSHGTRIMDMASYLNHSSQPNLVSIEDGKWFEATRDIKEGEELFVDYGDIADVDYN